MKFGNNGFIVGWETAQIGVADRMRCGFWKRGQRRQRMPQAARDRVVMRRRRWSIGGRNRLRTAFSQAERVVRDKVPGWRPGGGRENPGSSQGKLEVKRKAGEQSTESPPGLIAQPAHRPQAKPVQPRIE